MAKNPTPDYGRDLGKLEGSVDVLKTMTFTVIGFLATIVAGGIALFVVIGGVRADLTAEIQKVRTELSERIGKLETAINQLNGSQTTANGALTRIEQRLADAQKTQQPPALVLTGDQIQFLRKVLKFDPDLAYKAIGRVEEILPDIKLYDYPNGIAEKIPALKGTQYTFDIKGQLLIVSAADRRVVAVV